MVKLVIAMFAICLFSCGYRQIDDLTFSGKSYRCDRDGFCMHATGKRSLQAGFRDGAAEIRVDVVDAQVHRGESPENFAVLVSDQHENPLMISDSGRIPATWKIKHQESHAVQNIGEFSSERESRENLTYELWLNLKNKGEMKDICREDAYLVAVQILKDMVDRNNSFRKNGAPVVPVDGNTKSPFGLNDAEFVPKRILPFFSPTYGIHDLEEALAIGSVHRAGLDENAYRQLQQVSRPHVAGGMLHGDAEDRSEFVHLPHLEFQQIVYLWRKSAPAVMRIYPFQGAEHSASGMVDPKIWTTC